MESYQLQAPDSGLSHQDGLKPTKKDLGMSMSKQQVILKAMMVLILQQSMEVDTLFLNGKDNKLLSL